MPRGRAAASNEVGATPEPVPGPPGNLTATGSGGSVKLAWAAPSSQGGFPVTGYDLYQGTAHLAEGATPTHLPASPTSYTVSGLSPGVTRYFYVAAANTFGVGFGSPEASAVPTGAPSAPAILKAVAGNGQVITTPCCHASVKKFALSCWISRATASPVAIMTSTPGHAVHRSPRRNP